MNWIPILAALAIVDLSALGLSDLKRDGEYIRPPLSVSNYLARRYLE